MARYRTDDDTIIDTAKAAASSEGRSPGAGANAPERIGRVMGVIGDLKTEWDLTRGNLKTWWEAAQVRAAEQTAALEARKNAAWETQPDWYVRGPVGAITVRTYKDNERKRFEQELRESAKYGWDAQLLGETQGYIRGGVLLGGFLLWSRKKGERTIKYTRQS
jgi:hypothetical protein